MNKKHTPEWRFFKQVCKISKKEIQMIDFISNWKQDPEEVAEHIHFIKQVVKDHILTAQEQENFILSNNFFIDWAIKIQLSELGSEYVELLKEHTYQRWKHLIFRNPKYYFLYDWVNVSWIEKNGSINKYKIEDIEDIDKTILDITQNYENASKLIIKVIKDKSLDENTKRKILLWLIDTKQNILAFILNILFIVKDSNFLNENYEWELVFKRDEIKGLKKVLWDRIEDFKKKAWKLDIKLIANLLEKYSDIYVSILLWDKWADSTKDLLDIEKGQHHLFSKKLSIKKYLNNSFWELLKILDDYIINHTKRDTFKTVKKRVIQKLYRIYREENDPLIMIKTAINSFFKLKLSWFKSTDIIQLTSVNYWWILVWSYAKPIIERLNKNVQVELWYITYSIYDLKNKVHTNNGIMVTQYPRYNLLYTMESTKKELFEVLYLPMNKLNNIHTKNLHKNTNTDKKESTTWKKIKWDTRTTNQERKHTIIFDDNTYSWTTLNDLKIMLEKEWRKQVILAPARSNFDRSKYNREIPDDTIIDILWVCWIELRKAKNLKYRINSKWEKVEKSYVESVATVVWDMIYKNRKK